MRPPGSAQAVLCTLHHTTGLGGLEEIEGLVGRKETHVSVSPAVPWCSGELCTSHRAGRVGGGAVWYVVLLSSRHHCLHMPCPTWLWGQLCASPSAGDPACHWQLAAVEGESKGCKVGSARRKKWACTACTRHGTSRVGMVELGQGFPCGQRSFRGKNSRSSAVHVGQMKGEPKKSNSRPEVSSRLGCLRKQVGGAIS